MGREAPVEPHLPEELTTSVALAGDALSGAFIVVTLPMFSKNPYELFFGPADEAGRIVVTRAALEREIAATLQTGLMDYAPLTEWAGQILVSAFNAEDVDRALDGYATWGDVAGLYPADFPKLMQRLRERLHRNPDASLTLSVHIRPEGVTGLKIREKRAASGPDIVNPSSS